MLDQLKYLIRYQTIENRKSRLVRDYEETPKRIAELEKEFGQFEGEYLSKKAELDHSRTMHRAIEQGIADLEARIARSKQRMSEVKTNKEYQAMLREIDDTKKEISGKEDAALALMETIEVLSAQIQELEKDLEGRRKVMEEGISKFQEVSARLKHNLDELEAVADKIREKIQPDILKRSHVLFQRQAGVAVAAVENGVCQVCHLNIPPQKFIELQRDENILNCPHCRRFIYWPGHEGYQEAGGEDCEEA